MKVIIAGSRNITSYEKIEEAIKRSEFEITEVVSGGAKGVDLLGEMWAKKHSVYIKKFPAEWSKYGRSAGMKRNTNMAKYADALIAVWDGSSPGTKNMIHQATEIYELKVFVFYT